MLRHALFTLVFSSLFALSGVIAAAALIVGEPHDGVLDPSDSVTDDGKFEETLTLPLAEGEIVVIDLVSQQFDPILRVVTPAGTTLENDDGGSGVNSRLVFMAESEGEAQVVVTSYGSGSSGAYRLTVGEPELEEIVAGTPHSGTLEGVAAHRVAVNAGEMFVIEASSDDFDTILALRGPDGAVFENDDASNTDRNSRIIYTAAEDGNAILTVSSYTGSGGSYAVNCTALAADEVIEVTEDSPGSVQGELAQGGTEVVICIEAPARSRLRIDATSDVFDTVITAFSDDGWSEFNDDGGEGTNSMLRADVPESGSIFLRVNSYGNAGHGAFTVTAEVPEANRAPAFSLADVDGNVVTSDEFDGQIRIIDFWATWCPPCIAEIPHFNEIAAEYGDRGVSVIGISLDARAEAVVEFMGENAVNYTVVMDDSVISQLYGEMTEEGEIQYIPTTFVVDREGSIVNVHTGYCEKEVFAEDIEALLDSEE